MQKLNQKSENLRGGVKSNQEKSVDSTRGKDWYREKIVEMIKHIECLDYLEFIYNMMMAFKEKWGI